MLSSSTPLVVTRWPAYSRRSDSVNRPAAVNHIVVTSSGGAPEQWNPGTMRFFRQLWSALHTRALVIVPGQNDRAWVDKFGALIPCGSCRTHWQQQMIQNPPRWHDYFTWSVETHNAVSTRLGKAPMAVEAARKRWKGGAA